MKKFVIIKICIFALLFFWVSGKEVYGSGEISGEITVYAGQQYTYSCWGIDVTWSAVNGSIVSYGDNSVTVIWKYSNGSKGIINAWYRKTGIGDRFLAQEYITIKPAITTPPPAPTTPVNLILNSDYTGNVTYYALATNSINLQRGFKFKALSSSYYFRAQIKSQTKSAPIEISREYGKSEDPKLQLNVFPNPTSGLIQIETGKQSQIKEIEVINMNGITIFHKIFEGNKVDFDLSQYSKGVYIIKIIQQDGQQYTKKVQLE